MAVFRNRAALLEDYLDLWRAMHFRWASANCACHFAAGWVRLIEGRLDLADIEIGSAMDAARVVASHGGLSEATTQRLGRASIDPKQAKVGDLVLLPGPHFGALGICNASTAAALASGGFGIEFVEMTAAQAAWEIGR